MLGIDPTTSSSLDSSFKIFGSTGSDLVPVSCVCMMKLGTCIGLALACMGLHMQMHARTGACICTCISLKSLHDFLAWYLIPSPYRIKSYTPVLSDLLDLEVRTKSLLGSN